MTRTLDKMSSFKTPEDEMGFVYEVNLQVDEQQKDKFAKWLGPHIQEMLSFDGFVNATWYQRNNQDESISEEVVLWTIHYFLKSHSDYQNYIDTHAERMRADGMQRFAGNFSATRRLLHLHQVFG